MDVDVQPFRDRLRRERRARLHSLLLDLSYRTVGAWTIEPARETDIRRSEMQLWKQPIV
jgi:hypothetical protein